MPEQTQPGRRSHLRVLAAIGRDDFANRVLVTLEPDFDLAMTRAYSLEAFRASLASLDWDLVLCDPTLFDLAGTVAVIRDCPPGTPFIALAERWSDQERAEVLRAGARSALAVQHLELLPAIVGRELDAQRRRRLESEAERERARVALAASGALFRATFEQAAVGLTHVAPDGRWLRVNRRFCEIIGYSQEEVLALRFQNITHPDDLDADLAYLRQLLAGELDSFAMEKRYLRRDGGTVWVNLTVSLVRLPDGAPDYFITVIEDIDARKRTEAALRARDGELRLIVDHVPAMIAYFDEGLRCRYSNHAYTNFFSQIGDAVEGQAMETILGPENAPRARPGFEAALSGTPQRYEAQRTRRDGTPRMLEVAMVPNVGEDGRVGGIFTLCVDVTGRIEAEKLRLDRTRLEAANEELNAFAYTAAHDLRAPLRAISGFSGLLRTSETDTLTEEGRRFLMRIESGAQRAHELVEALLNYARSAQSELAMTVLDLETLVLEAVEVLRPNYPSARVRVDSLPAAQGDRELIWDVLLNLIGNAFKFSSHRTHANVEIGTMQTARGDAVFIRDNGAGFDPQYAGKLFGVFQRLHNESEFPGTGIGLAFARRVLARHGSEIWAESRPGRGATFYFTPPRRSVA